MLEKVFYTSVLVTDQDKALDFYTNVLGMEKRVENPTPDGPRFLTVGVKGDDFQLVLWPGTPGQAQPAMGRPPASITIETDDIRKTFDELKSRGVEFASDVLEFPWGSVAQFQDPDGNRLQIREGRYSPRRADARCMAASVRLWTPSFVRMWLTWWPAVFSLMKSVRAIRALDIPSADKLEHLQFARGELAGDAAAAAGRFAEVAQQRGGGVHRPGRAELAERGDRGPCFVDGDLRRLGGDRARELESRLSNVERHRERAERGQRAVSGLGRVAVVARGDRHSRSR